jgi:DNA-binding transcriptional LysR family regulator
MKRDHPLAKKEVLRLRDCLNYPIALPTSQIGVRHLLEVAARQTSLKLDPAIESDSFDFLTNYAREENIITFQIPIGLPKNDLLSSMISRPINTRDVPPGVLYFGQLRGRTLPVAAARFANQLLEAFAARFECD